MKFKEASWYQLNILLYAVNDPHRGMSDMNVNIYLAWANGNDKLNWEIDGSTINSFAQNGVDYDKIQG